MTAALADRLFCTVPEAAQVLELDPRTLRRAIEAGEFPAVRVAGTVRVPVARLLALAGLDPDTHDESDCPTPGGTPDHHTQQVTP